MDTGQLTYHKLYKRSTPNSSFIDDIRTLYSGLDIVLLSNENGTSPELTEKYLEQFLSEELDSLFAIARAENFDDPITTRFATDLISIMDNFGNQAIQIIRRMIQHKQVVVDIAEQALKIIGMDENRFNHNDRRELLEACLSHNSIWVRNGAIKGISYMDDPKALNSITKALETEKVPELREYMLYLQTRYTQKQAK
jgi:hypothetical protein